MTVLFVAWFLSESQSNRPHNPTLTPQSTFILHTDWVICISVCDFVFLFFWGGGVNRRHYLTAPPPLHYVTELCLISNPVETPRQEAAAASPLCLSEWRPCGGNVLSMSRVRLVGDPRKAAATQITASSSHCSGQWGGEGTIQRQQRFLWFSVKR